LEQFAWSHVIFQLAMSSATISILKTEKVEQRGGKSKHFEEDLNNRMSKFKE